MTHKHNGGPAFPLPVADQECHGRFESGYGGMSLRDYFAAKAMQARISDYESCKSLAHASAKRNVSFAAEVAAQAYDMADAMLAQRGK